MTNSTWLTKLLTQLTNNRHRQLLVIEGDKSWQHLWLNSIQQAFLETNPRFKSIAIVDKKIVSASFLEQILNTQLAHMLGQEVDLVVFDSRQGISPNSLAQATGMIRAGGLCVLLLQTDWLKSTNPAMKKFLSYPLKLTDAKNGFRKFLNNKLATHAIRIKQGKNLPEDIFTPPPQSHKISMPTSEQNKLIDAVDSVAFGHRKRPLLINADRGRGKSSALGFAAIELFKKGKTNIAITAASPMQTEQILVGAKKYAIKIAKFDSAQILEGGGVFKAKGQSFNIQFYAPDDLIANKKSFDILFVDEAAHLPLPILKQLTETYGRIVFASTDSGYEGSGRGFKLRFTKILQNFNNKHLSLLEPIRWNINDPLELAINESLLLAHNSLETIDTDPTNLKYEKQSLNDLFSQPELLSQIFNLLVNAHYQTSPNNLMQMLEDPNSIMWLATNSAQQPIAVLLAFKEGGVKSITTGKRYQGHLVAQLLLKQTQNNYWLTETSYRVNRLAVLHDLQGKGVGTKLLQAFVQHSQEDNNVSYISTSFAGSSELIRFWQKQGFSPAYLGLKRDKASANHSLTMLYGLNKKSQQVVANNLTSYSSQFAHLLQSSFQDLDADTVLQLIKFLPFSQLSFPIKYLEQQPFEAVSQQLQLWSLANFEKIENMPTEIKKAWVAKILQNKSWLEVISQQHHFISRKQLEIAFKDWFR